MKYQNNIYITECDFKKLNNLLETIETSAAKDRVFIEQLRKEIERAQVVSADRISGNIVTINSEVLLQDMSTREEFACRVVFPSDADVDSGRISVLAPVGTALLGYKAGDIVSWKVPSGIRKLKIKEVLYQPESEGDLC